MVCLHTYAFFHMYVCVVGITCQSTVTRSFSSIRGPSLIFSDEGHHDQIVFNDLKMPLVFKGTLDIGWAR